MRTLTSLVRRKVVTESGLELGRCFDVRAELTKSSLKVTGLCVGRGGWAEHLGLGTAQRRRDHDVVSWDAVVRIEGERIVVRDPA